MTRPKQSLAWFAFYPKDFNAGTAHMNCEEVGIYVRLLIHQSQQGSVEANRVKIIPGSYEKPESLKTVLKKFRRRGNRLINPRMEKTRAEREQFSAKQSKNAAMRWHSSGIANGHPKSMPQRQPLPQPQPHPQTINNLFEGKNNFEALRLANLIFSNHGDWHYDNCKVDITKLKPSSLQTVILPHAQHGQKKVLKAWTGAVFTAHGAKVDGLAKDATAYAVEVFKRNLEQIENHENKKNV